ncbi:MAG: MerR family transcriptional regulator [Ignavibacteriales bacterium]|nr:MerR family transcriptional regulator [Ignavibacteriales bacterium]
MKDFNIKKLYYSISEVSKITEVEQYVLRFWESEFEQLKPQKNRAGNRIYTNKDIKLIMFIKSLLREKKYTIEGAKQVLADFAKSKNTKLDPAEIKEPNLFQGDEESDAADERDDFEIEDEDDERALLYEDLEEIRGFLTDMLKRLG